MLNPGVDIVEFYTMGYYFLVVRVICISGIRRLSSIQTISAIGCPHVHPYDEPRWDPHCTVESIRRTQRICITRIHVCAQVNRDDSVAFLCPPSLPYCNSDRLWGASLDVQLFLLRARFVYALL